MKASAKTEGLTRSAALDYTKQGIRINAVNPGRIATEMIDRLGIGANDATAMVPMGRMGQAAEIAQAVVFLCTGENLMIAVGTPHVVAAIGARPAHGLMIAAPSAFARLLEATGTLSRTETQDMALFERICAENRRRDFRSTRNLTLRCYKNVVNPLQTQRRNFQCR